MTPDEFQAFAEANPAVRAALQGAIPATPTPSYYTGLTEAAALVLLFPLARFLLTEIGNHFSAAQTCYNVAVAYARAALRGFQHYGERAQQYIDRTQAFIARIEQAGNS